MSGTDEPRRRPGRPKDPARREAVLDAARELFASHGYVGARVAGLAERAGLTKAAVLHHFGNKRALYLEVMGNSLGALMAPVVRAAMEPGGYADRLDRLTDATVAELARHPEAAKLLIGEILGRGPFVEGPGGSAITEGLAAIVDFLSAGMDAGTFRRQEPRQLTWSIIGAHLLYFAAADVVDPAGFETERRSGTARAAAMREHVRAMVLPLRAARSGTER